MKKIESILEWVASYNYFAMSDNSRRQIINLALKRILGSGNTFGTTTYYLSKPKES